jgi:hypothetical protein
MYKSPVDLQSLVRTMGYAAWPLALSVGMLIPIIFPLFALFPLALLTIMVIYAVQSASGADSRQVVISSLVGIGVMILVLGFLATINDITDAPMGAGIFGILVDFSI